MAWSGAIQHPGGSGHPLLPVLLWQVTALLLTPGRQGVRKASFLCKDIGMTLK